MGQGNFFRGKALESQKDTIDTCNRKLSGLPGTSKIGVFYFTECDVSFHACFVIIVQRFVSVLEKCKRVKCLFALPPDSGTPASEFMEKWRKTTCTVDPRFL